MPDAARQRIQAERDLARLDRWRRRRRLLAAAVPFARVGSVWSTVGQAMQTGIVTRA